jgi:extracellular factor (EF) 3-hydroxypalmitic acid methyl ester biosynthesis protein
VEAEAKIVCEASLDEMQWAILDPSPDEEAITNQFKDFLIEWQKLYKIVPEFKVVVADLQTYLTDVRLWLNQLEINLGNPLVKSRRALERKLLQSLSRKIISDITSMTERFESVLDRVDEDSLPRHQAFCRRLLHPVAMCSPFMYRTFHKPLGYAGDYEMVNMMLRDPFEGETLFAKLLNAYALQLPPVIGHRNRIHYLKESLAKETLRMMRLGRCMRVFNLGCGPAQEVQNFLANDTVADYADFTLADFNQETLDYTGRLLNELKRRHQRQTEIKMTRRTVQQLLKETGRSGRRRSQEQYDVVYCAGLFDYLSDQICRELVDVFYAMLAPGGLLMTTNVDKHPARHQTECFLDWRLVFRNQERMRSLAPAQAAPEDVVIKCDASGVNVFLEIRKPKDA